MLSRSKLDQKRREYIKTLVIMKKSRMPLSSNQLYGANIKINVLNNAKIQNVKIQTSSDADFGLENGAKIDLEQLQNSKYKHFGNLFSFQFCYYPSKDCKLKKNNITYNPTYVL